MCMYCEEDATTHKTYDGVLKFMELPTEQEFNRAIYYTNSYIFKTNNMYFLRTHYAITKIFYCPICRKEVGRVNEDEIRKRIEILEIRKNGYLEVGNTNQVRKIENEIHKWEDLLERINGSLEKKVEKLENFIKSKDLWESYLHF